MKDGADCNGSKRVRQLRSIEKRKFADIIAVAGNPLVDVTEMQRVRFVMKGGLIVRNDR